MSYPNVEQVCGRCVRDQAPSKGAADREMAALTENAVVITLCGHHLDAARAEAREDAREDYR